MAGLDIGRSEVRIVELSGNRVHTAQLACCAREALPDGAISDEGIGNLRQVMEAVSRLWEKSGSLARQVAIAIPATSAMTHILSVPANSSQAQRALLAGRHAESMLPFPAAQALLDFRIIGPTRNAPGQLDMLIAAARRDDVEDRIAVAESLGLQTVVADIDSHAAMTALTRMPSMSQASSSFALANLETHGALLSLFCDGHIAGEQQLAIGYRQLQRDMQHDSRHDARHDARHDVQQYDADHSDVLATYLAHAAAHIARAVQTLQQQTSHMPAHIVLAGPGAGIPGMVEAVRKHTTIPIAVATPFDGMALAPAIDAAQLTADNPASYVTACGLALRRFDR